MATVRTDAARPDFVVAATLPAAGTVFLGNDTKADNAVAQGGNGGLNTRPFSAQALLGFNHVSLTLQVTGNPTGTITVQVTDFGGDNANATTAYAIPNSQWANTTYTQGLSGAAGTYNIPIANIASKWLRISYTATSGTGTINVAITCRANGR